MALERASRAYSSGLRTDEYITHGTLVTFRTAAVILAYLAHRAGTMTMTASLARMLIPGTIVITVLHILVVPFPALIPRPRLKQVGTVGE
jgi:hypothetical protein